MYYSQQGAILSTQTVSVFILGAPSVDPCHPDYAPSIFAHKKTIDGSQKLERYQRRPSVVESINSSLEVTHADPEEGCTAVGTDLSMADIDQLQNENIELKRKMASLEMKLESQEKHWSTICFCVFHPPHLLDKNMERIINLTYPSRAVSCGPDEASSRLNSSRPRFSLQSELWNCLKHLS